MNIQPNSWQPVPGMAAVQIYPIFTRPSIVSSNCYVLRSPTAIVVIDPGASAAQTVLLSEVVCAALAERARPVLVLLSHCHQDHSQEASNLALPQGTEVILCIEGSGADALETGNRELTFCCYYPWNTKICSVKAAIRLFSGSASGAVDAAGAITRGADSLTLPTGPLHREWLQLSDADRLELYQTPGHSNCSITIKAGEMLFLGDLPFAANPGLCGIYGWNHAELMSSIATVEGLIVTAGVSICLPGHGFAQTPEVARKNLQVMAEDSAGLSEVGTLCPDRIAALKSYLGDVLEEASYLFTVISGQLYTLGFHLADLEEETLCQEVLAALDLDKIEQCLMDFRRFARDFDATDTPDLTFVLKGVQVSNRLLSLLGSGTLAGLIDLSLSGRAHRLLEDFLSMARGLQFTGADESDEINALIAALIERIRLGQVDDLDAVAESDVDDPNAFARVLVRRLATRSLLEQVVFEFDATAQPTTAHVCGERLTDIVLCLIEGVAGVGVRHIRLQTLHEHGDVVLRLTSREPLSDQGFGMRRLNLYNRTLSWTGGGLTYLAGQGFELRVPAMRTLAHTCC
jgi:glyoxylase-like metal-dependent hydrolase (beta-lactamase superfamily II)